MEACHRAGCACLSPVALKSSGRCALRTLPDPAPDLTPTPLLLILQTFAPLPTTSPPATSLRGSGASVLPAWLHEKFFGLWNWESFQRCFTGARRHCGLLTLRGPLADSYRGKILPDRVYLGSGKGEPTSLTALSNSGCGSVRLQHNPKTPRRQKGQHLPCKICIKCCFKRQCCFVTTSSLRSEFAHQRSRVRGAEPETSGLLSPQDLSVSFPPHLIPPAGIQQQKNRGCENMTRNMLGMKSKGYWANGQNKVGRTGKEHRAAQRLVLHLCTITCKSRLVSKGEETWQSQVSSRKHERRRKLRAARMTCVPPGRVNKSLATKSRRVIGSKLTRQISVPFSVAVKYKTRRLVSL